MRNHSITPSHPSVPQIGALAVVQGSLEAAAGWAFGRIFHYISPSMGALFGFTMGVSHTIVAALLDRLLGTSDVEKVAKFIISFAISAAIAVGVLTLVGYSITIETGLVFALVIAPLRLVTDCIFRCILNCAQSVRP
jgi:hypothetical protein